MFIPCVEITGVQWIRASLRGEEAERWEARGEDGVFGPGHPVTFGVTPEGFSNTVEPDPFDWAGETIYFSLVNTAVTRRVWIVDGAELVEGEWLDQNGRLHDEPCS